MLVDVAYKWKLHCLCIALSWLGPLWHECKSCGLAKHPKVLEPSLDFLDHLVAHKTTLSEAFDAVVSAGKYAATLWL